MSTDIVVPTLGESVTEATIAKWFKTVGDTVARDEPLVELETDKVAMEVPAPAPGTLTEIVAGAGATVAIGAVLGRIAEGKGAPAPTPAAPAEGDKPELAELATSEAGTVAAVLSPAVRKLVAEHHLDPAAIQGSGKGGRLTKGDVLSVIEAGGGAGPAPVAAAQPAPVTPIAPAASAGPRPRADREERVRMTRLRQRIAERLKAAQNTAAMLTTYNEIDMTNAMALRAEHRDAFEKKYGVRLGFMSFFVKACIAALQEIPGVNAEIDGADVVYKNYYDIGVAVGTPQGLVVAVVRDADALSFAELEKRITELGRRARDGKIALDDLVGGTFTISNGGVFGSLLSSPILNPPQSGILGMHKIEKRPVVIDDAIEARPMMYVALSYDHRIIDGGEAVRFLVRVKECIEDPGRLLLGL